MKIRIKKKGLENLVAGVLLFTIFITLFFGVSITGNLVLGNDNNVTNNTVLARVNVTNTEPNITSIRVDDSVSSPADTIDLTPFDATIVTCNATVFDYNGWQDIDPNETRADFHIQGIDTSGATDNNYFYQNTSCNSCRQATSAEATADGHSDSSMVAICDCKFGVQYYANSSSSWVCNISVTDSGGTQIPSLKINLSDNETSDFTVTVTELLAINTSTLLDYGNLSVTEVSSEVVHNVSNGGNTAFNVSLRGYGGTNESIGTNSTMLCELGNISFGNQRYALGSELIGSTAFGTMINLTNQTVNTNMTLPHRVDDASPGRDQNTTVWRLEVPLSVGGICNGTIIFGAIPCGTAPICES